MAVSTAPTVAPAIPWEKSQPQSKSSPTRKVNPLQVIAVAAIVLLALAGIWRATHQSATGQFVKVVTARQDIPAGARLGFMTVSYLDVPKAFATGDMIIELNDVNNRVARTFIPSGEPVLTSYLFPNHDGLSLSLENDERAITLQLNDDALVDHAIAPDDRVDILAISSKEGERYTKTICQNARVLMSAPKEQLLARHMGNATNNKITIAVTPQLAEIVTEAAETGKIRLVLRNHLTRTDQHLLGAEPRDLLPAKALVDSKPSHPELNVSEQKTALLPPPVMSIPTLPAMLEPPAESVKKWLVEVFLGDHKESYDVPKM
jgi:Flp pilus assembly protein CpaB